MQNRSQALCGGSFTQKIPVNPKMLSWILSGIAILFAGASLACQYSIHFKQANLTKLIALLDVDTELSLPTIYSVLLLFNVVLLLALITSLKKKEKSTFVCAWLALTLGFLFLTLDEGATIHEKMMAPLRAQLGDNLPPFFYFTWVIPGLIEVALTGAFFLKFLKHLPTKARTGFILSAVVYLGGALGFELISGAYTSSYGTENLHFNLLTTIEELLEMLGMVLFIRTLLTYISDTYAGLQLVFLSSTPT